MTCPFDPAPHVQLEDLVEGRQKGYYKQWEPKNE
jgi:hypothetical protein